MFIANFITLKEKEYCGVQVSFLDFTVCVISRKAFLNRISEKYGKDFNMMYFGGVNYYVK